MVDNVSVASTDDPWCDSTNPRVVPFEEVLNAQQLITTPEGITPSPCIRAKMSDVMGTEVYLKLENLNETGSFKERGARYLMLRLSDEERSKGVVTASLGNHSQGVSYHGMKLGIPVTVVMPVTAPLMKVRKCMRYKANVVSQGQNMVEAKQIARDLAKEKGMTFINGYDHPYIIAGQGTIGLEILDQIGSPDAVIIPCGGGGLITGILVAMKEKSPSTEIIGVESERCPGFSVGLQHGRPKKVPCLQSIADGLAVGKVGYNTIATCKGKVDHMVTVSDGLINVGILTMIEYEKIVTEGAGASPLAALLSGKLKHLKGKKVVLVLSGGNIDAVMLGRVLERALVSLGRYVKVAVWVVDGPNGLPELLRSIADLGVSVKHMLCERAWIPDDDYCVKVTLMAETRDIDNAMDLMTFLAKKYEKVEFQNFPSACRAKALSTLDITF